jgi:excinuclease ABC subunit A
MIMAPIVRDRKGEYRREQKELREKGFVRARIDSRIVRLDHIIPLGRYEKHTIEAVIDRIKVQGKTMPRIREAMETAVAMTGSVISILVDTGDEIKPARHAPGPAPGMTGSRKKGKEIYIVQSTALACARCGISLPEMEPRLFSFNSAQGACPSCQGLGYKQEFDPALIIPDEGLSVEQGAIGSITENGNVMFSRYGMQELRILAGHYKFDLNTPWKGLSRAAKNIIFYGSRKALRFTLKRERSWKTTVRKENRRIRGVIDVMQRVWDRWHIPMMEKYMRTSVCSACKGARLSPASLAVRFQGKDIVWFNRQSVEASRMFFREIVLGEAEQAVGKEILKEIRSRLRFMSEVGLGYLTLDRSAASLSGGEAQRIRLASQVGAGLRGVMYILDEPSIGLHARDHRRLLQTLGYLKALGNSLIVVEHDEETMLAADHVLDMGPGAGSRGGEIICSGTLDRIKSSRRSVTGAYLRGQKEIALPKTRRRGNNGALRIVGARANNLRNIDVTVPLGMFVCITGVSGSGKSTLVDFVLKRTLARHLYHSSKEPGQHKMITGMEQIDRLVEINQSPIGRTPRSNPATYTRVFDSIRDLYAGLPESRVRGYRKGRFSFNVQGGRCEECRGAGVKVVEMQLLADVAIPCEACGGRRFNDATLEVHYRGRNIYDILEMSVMEALDFFRFHPRIRRGLEMLGRIGLGYVKLGQPSTTLSGGEAQRVKLASELQKPGTGRTLYILDEPTTGLHFKDISCLLDSLQSLVDRGNSIIVIEHNLDVIKTADYIIDMGPGGGDQGGEIIAAGTPEALARAGRSFTGRVLKPHLVPGRVRGARSAVRRRKDSSRDIRLRGCCKHNLKNINVTIPHNRLTVVTGVSGSGKSSLAFGTLFAEGQRRFIESLSTYARRFLGRLERGDVESITGLAPAIAIDQKTAGRSSKSTVATITEIYDYFRLMYARLGELYCPECGRRMESFSAAGISGRIQDVFKGKTVKILAPLYLHNVAHDFFLDTPEHVLKVAPQLLEQGFRKLWINGRERRIDRISEQNGRGNIYLHVDRIPVKQTANGRLAEAVETALEKGHGIMEAVDRDHSLFFSMRPFCPKAHFFLREDIEPRNFSFNSHWGACETCSGFGKTRSIDADRLIVRPHKPLLGSGIGGMVGRTLKRKGGYYRTLLKELFKSWGKGENVCYDELNRRQKRDFLYGISERLHIVRRRRRSVSEYLARWRGLVPLAEKWYESRSNSGWAEEKQHMVCEKDCPECNGTRLKKPFCHVTVGGKDIGELCRMTVAEALRFFRQIEFTREQRILGRQILHEIRSRLAFLESVGLGYLGLDRVGSSLAGGEAQRIRLASQIGSGLEGVLYVLDEPTVGLHQRDTQRLVKTLRTLRDLGNTVVVVEHDPEMIRSADWIIDMGPGAGEQGGEIVATGSPERIERLRTSITGDYLAGRKRMQQFPDSTFEPEHCIEIRGAARHNLRNINVRIPLGCLVTFCGVSGSGKSSLVMDVVVEAVSAQLLNKPIAPGFCSGFKLPSCIDGLIVVDQAPLGATPRSCPITYGKVFDSIRELFAAVPLAKVKGFRKSRFSLNTGKGRCEICAGMGAVRQEMHFLSDVWVTCDSCRGKRFNVDTLEILYKGKNISEVLEMTVENACDLFSAHRRIHTYLKTLRDVGLGYLRLGRSSSTLSGGEAQRVKLAAELARNTRKRNLYVFDEPTTGLHMADIHQLLNVLNRLVKKGHSILLIEHQLNLIAASDWLLELGPGGGEEGGRLLFCGKPAALLKKGGTPTAISLREFVK